MIGSKINRINDSDIILVLQTPFEPLLPATIMVLAFKLILCCIAPHLFDTG